MSQERPMHTSAIPARRRVPINLTRIRRAPVVSQIGLPEMIGLASAAILLLVTVVAYFYFYLPAQSRLTSAQLERERLQVELRTYETEYDNTKSVTERVNEITDSMSQFEVNYLSAAATGRMSLYTTLNELMKSNGLRNTAGPSYTPLEPVGTKTQVQPTASAEKQTNAKWQTIYPGVAVSVTVEGPYQRVRHFVRDIERSRQFLIINAVELESVTQSGVPTEVPAVMTGRGLAPEAAIATGGRSTLVSLRLEMATYFQQQEQANAQ